MDLNEKFLKLTLVISIFCLIGSVVYVFVYVPSQTVIGEPGVPFEEEKTFTFSFLDNDTSINASLLIIDEPGLFETNSSYCISMNYTYEGVYLYSENSSVVVNDNDFYIYVIYDGNYYQDETFYTYSRFQNGTSFSILLDIKYMRQMNKIEVDEYLDENWEPIPEYPNYSIIAPSFYYFRTELIYYNQTLQTLIEMNNSTIF